MLILKRNSEDVVDIYFRSAHTGEEAVISVKVLDITSKSVRLGFDAPKDVLILRREVPRRPEGEEIHGV